jgi:deazaflavin-dependent oxidoreductase (nitroreductase family)
MAELEGSYEPGAWDWVNDQVAAYERSDGKEAGTLQGTDYPIIVVSTRGAKTGKVRKFGLMRVVHDGEYALVASKGGMPHNPAWVNNLEAHPDDVVIQDGADRFGVHVRLVEGDERQAWWDRAVAAYPDYETYRANTDRHIPVYVATRD